jgi:hypothetical protein
MKRDFLFMSFIEISAFSCMMKTKPYLFLEFTKMKIYSQKFPTIYSNVWISIPKNEIPYTNV